MHAKIVTLNASTTPLTKQIFQTKILIGFPFFHSRSTHVQETYEFVVESYIYIIL